MTAHILIVDDEPRVAEPLSFALKREHFRVTHVERGEQALAVLDKDPPALVVLDVGLPDINGFDVLKRVRRDSEVPVLFLTAREDELDRILGLELGGDDYVTKPFSPREVVARVRAILKRQGAAPALRGEGRRRGPARARGAGKGRGWGQGARGVDISRIRARANCKLFILTRL